MSKQWSKRRGVVEMSQLEARQMMAQTIELLNNKNLVVIGSTASERVNLSIVSGKLTVEFIGGLKKTFTASGVIKIAVNTSGGNDVIYNSLSVNIPVNADGGSGNDTIYGGSGKDTITGASGNDSVFGGPGNDTIRGGTGNDLLLGETGDDFMYDEAGNDTLNGGAGSDSIFGSPDGNDSDVYQGHSGTIAANENGHDYFRYLDRTKGVRISLDFAAVSGYGDFAKNTSVERDRIKFFGTIFGTDHGDLIEAKGSLSSFYPLGGVALNGKAGNDTILGSLGYDGISGGHGNDKITDQGTTGGSIWGDLEPGVSDNGTFFGKDTIYGSSGNDRIQGDKSDDVIYAYGGNDTILDSQGNDLINGGDGNDYINSGIGNDTIYGGSGKDQIFGDDGNDRIYVDDDEKDTINGGNGTDWADVDPSLDIVSAVETKV